MRFFFDYTRALTILLSLLLLLDDEDEDDDDDVDMLEVEDNDDDEVEVVEQRKPPAKSIVATAVSVSSSPASTLSIGLWNPDYIKGKYQDAVTMAWHQVLLIVLPSGVGASASTEDVDLRTEWNNTVLAVQHCYPKWISHWHFFSLLKKALLKQAKQQWQSFLNPSKQEEAMHKFQESFALMAHALRAQMTTIELTLKFLPSRPLPVSSWTLPSSPSLQPTGSSLVMNMVSACRLLT